MKLDSFVTAVAYKKLVLVDLPEGSNQHEINGVSNLKKFFLQNGTETRVSGKIQWHFFADNIEPVHDSGRYTFYDARAKSRDRTGRQEWRLYYSDDFLKKASPGDDLLLVRTVKNEIHGLVFQKGSGWSRSAKILFNLEEIPTELKLLSPEYIREKELQYVEIQILSELGFELEVPIDQKIEECAYKAHEEAKTDGNDFPGTIKMSELARNICGVNPEDADKALLECLDVEERLFKAIEKIVVQKKLKAGFNSVDDFINYSLSVQNRRKSRMGYALQNHLEWLFKKHGLRFESQITVEGKKPDFLFPGHREYLDHNFDENRLVMLAAKSSCKDRWSQILTEASRIKKKHLCTLDQTISGNTIIDMINKGVILVLPYQLRKLYNPDEQEKILTVNQFIEYVRELQE